MKKALTAIIASVLMSLAPQTAMTQTESNKSLIEQRTYKFTKCDFIEGFSAGYFGIGFILSGRVRKCFFDDSGNFDQSGVYLDPSGSDTCTVYVQDGKYTDKDCPNKVFKQIVK